jgi:4a-hydroxytetrahydrobiopterin dehydratase
MERLSGSEIDERLAVLAEWRLEGDSIARDVALADFAAAIAFVERVAALAESADHHPDILIHAYKHVRLTLTTHSAGGLTDRDFTLARSIS